MKTQRNGYLPLCCLVLVLGYATSVYAQSDTLAGAKFDLLDRFNVNMASGQVQLSQTPLSIGGAMGLRHTISSQTSDFVNLLGHGGGRPSVLGFGDSNRGALYSVILRETDKPSDRQYGLRAFGGGANEDFGLGASGNWLPYQQPSAATLKFETSAEFTGHVLTTADGTRMYYPGEEILSVVDDYRIKRPMSKIVYPNGFTIEVSTDGRYDGSIYSVRTNTGFQLKYDFTGSWTISSPTRVTALNNAIERCPHYSQDPCGPDPGGIWPYATYTWPVNQPNMANIDALRNPSVFRVKDAAGGVTDYHHKSYQSETGPHAPRIVKIEKDGDVVMNYTYRFRPVVKNYANYSIIYTAGVAAVGGASVDGGGAQGYTMHTPKTYYGNQIAMFNQANPGPGRVNYVQTANYGAFEEIVAWDQRVKFSSRLLTYTNEDLWYVENTVTQVLQKTGNVRVTFSYDARGNVTARMEDGRLVAQADYPATCTSNNFRYCNKPTWIEDAVGNRTNYYYHGPSGQIRLRESPANSDGVKAKTAYEYTQYYAHFKKDSETIEAADTPVWLLSKEIHCQRGDLWALRSCLNGDAVTTTYEYDYYNLFLVGVAVTAKNADGVMETRRTCYEYDVYGNRIGETSPRADLASCQ